MARVEVVPPTFGLVRFDAARIAELADDVATRVGLPADATLRIEVDEASPLVRTSVASLEPVTLAVEGGAFEEAKRPRTMSEDNVTQVLARLLYRVRDRLDPAFGDPPPDAALGLAQATAWDAYAMGRAERLGLSPHKSRWRYHFRNRHGFSDVADAVFERLWAAEGLAWADLEAAVAETSAARAAASA